MAGLDSLLTETPHLLVDGAMGTELFARGLTSGDSPELWNVERAGEVVDVHRSYIGAGADIVLTNSFGGTSFRLALHGLQERVGELNEAAARNARTAADATDRRVLVAGSMGPTGELLEPLGAMTPRAASAAFADQARGLAAGGADLLWIETMSSLEEIECAVAGARTGSDLPIAVTLSFDTAGRTMMGVTAEAAAEHLAPLAPVAIGANCGNNIADTEAAVLGLVGTSDVPVIVKANAGIPEFRGDRLHYTATPEIMGAHARRMMDAGVSIIGGCCGTTCGHIAYMREVIDGSVEPPDLDAPIGMTRADASPDTAERVARRRARRRS